MMMTESPWAVVLAGGSGVRLRPLVKRIVGDERPKQFVPLLGRRTLLAQTLDRVALRIPPGRTVIVTLAEHARYVEKERLAGQRVLVQAADRGTGAGILAPARHIARIDPRATVVVLPSDQFVSDERAFMDHVGAVAGWIARHPDRVVLVGVAPARPEVEYGWIEPGADAGGGIRAVRRFWEKPPLETARACLERGYLWNTFVIVARAATLIAATEAALPGLGPGTPTPAFDFSRDVLAAGPPSLAVSTLSGVAWCDLGSPARVLDLAQRMEPRPEWLAA